MNVQRASADVQLSVVIPTFNRRAHLVACLDALGRQTLPPRDYEVIVVVDGSTDGTIETLRRYRSDYRVLIEEQENAGQASARNRGSRMARAPYLLFLDDDIVAGSGLVAEHLAAQTRSGGVVAVGHLDFSIDGDVDGLSKWLHTWWRDHYFALASDPERPSFRDAYAGNLSLPANVFWRAGGFSPDFSRIADAVLGWRLAEIGMKFVYVPEAAGSQQHSKRFRELAREIEARGCESVAFAERHPGALSELALGGFGKASAAELAVRRMLLRLQPPLGVLASIDPVLRRLPKAQKLYVLLHSYFYWRGVKSAVRDPQHWRVLTHGD
jgi:GT2 family glycosyltransferase